ncbi:FlgB family protein [Pseudoruegeria sp. HB172150]|uniref:FlgB family protein n=1 Tax=Pseudoruegeria sp. HB172150 TaxID=2721164 RepID=UPI0015567A6C|nr:FlgB family protein [Pseudoruegeria sp. HB172150]
MFDRIEIFRMAHALAAHASARQAEIAANVANADTPGYRAHDVEAFSEFYKADRGGAGMRSTRAGHLGEGSGDAVQLRRFETQTEAAPNGNTVSLESEMMKAAQVSYAHDSALSVYEAARNVLRLSLGRGR